MYLAKLEIQGFKSFANKSTLDFQRGITAIVGPNGSGKSNVADAIRWVLGEQSLKLLRGKKSDDVIFAGSDKKSRLGVAEVSLYLNNEDRGAPIDYSELVITRRVYRDGEGEYLINHQPTRLQDILMLLAQANFGQRTYSVIGQGMIDQFLVSSPQERKHLFDEAAGVRQYQLKRDQALSKLEQTTENLTQGEAIMVEIEPRLRSLTRQVRRLERREEVEKNLRQQQRLYYGILWSGIAGEAEQLRQELVAANTKRQEIEHQLAAIQKELDAIEQERTASEIFSGLQKKYNQILDDKNRLLERQSSVKSQLETSARKTGQTETVFWQRRAQELKRNADGLTEEIALTTQQIARQKKLFAEKQQAAAAAMSVLETLETQWKDIQATWRQQRSWPQIQAAVTAIFLRYDELVVDLHAEQCDLPKVRQRAKHLQQEMAAVAEQLEKTSGASDPDELARWQEKLISAARLRQETAQTAASLETELRLAEQRQQQLNTQLAALVAEQERVNKELSSRELAQTHPEDAYAALVQETKKLGDDIAVIDRDLQTARQEINDFNEQETTKKARLFTRQKDFRDTQHELNESTARVNDRQVKQARIEQRLDDLKREIIQSMSATEVDEVAAIATTNPPGDTALLAEEIARYQHQLQLIGGIDEQITEEYKTTNERWEFLKNQSDDLRQALSSLEKAIAELDTVIKQRFDAAFRRINDEFSTTFRTLFRGGRAELVLVREVVLENEPTTEAEAAEAGETPAVAAKQANQKVVTGIEIKATPPGKKLQSIAMLSGGEKALTSIALLCAIIANNPSPFVTLDEVDAALDEANSQRFAHILDQLAHKTQFITITHNRATMEKATILYGITMGDDGISQLLSVKMDQVEEIIKKHGNR